MDSSAVGSGKLVEISLLIVGRLRIPGVWEIDKSLCAVIRESCPTQKSQKGLLVYFQVYLLPYHRAGLAARYDGLQTGVRRQKRGKITVTVSKGLSCANNALPYGALEGFSTVSPRMTSNMRRQYLQVSSHNCPMIYPLFSSFTPIVSGPESNSESIHSPL